MAPALTSSMAASSPSAAGDHDHGKVGIPLANQPDGSEAIEIRQLEVAEDDLGLELLQRLQEGLAPVDPERLNCKSGITKVALDQLRVGRLVLQDEDP